ncbi:MAG: hypothetical protein DMG31_13430 [Acidobacteria bacterium]|nr:MAG: hypothetical protein DMG31_13430 [Acidobacteriota bacterium]
MDFDRLTSKVERAEHHITYLCVEWDKFRVQAYKVSSNDDFNTGERIYRLEQAWPIPDMFPAIVGDAVHCLRSALDHLIYRMAEVYCQKPPLIAGLYFPTGNNRDEFIKCLEAAAEHKSKKSGVVKRLGPEAIKALKAIEAYDGGKGAILRHIHCLDLFDKHRTLLTAALSNPLVTMDRDSIARYKAAVGITDRLTPDQEASVFKTESCAPFPLKQGDILHRVPIAKANENMKPEFQIAFGEPQVVKGKPIAPTLHQAAHLIRDITWAFYESGFLS